MKGSVIDEVQIQGIVGRIEKLEGVGKVKVVSEDQAISQILIKSSSSETLVSIFFLPIVKASERKLFAVETSCVSTARSDPLGPKIINVLSEFVEDGSDLSSGSSITYRSAASVLQSIFWLFETKASRQACFARALKHFDQVVP